MPVCQLEDKELVLGDYALGRPSCRADTRRTVLKSIASIVRLNSGKLSWNEGMKTVIFKEKCRFPINGPLISKNDLLDLEKLIAKVSLLSGFKICSLILAIPKTYSKQRISPP